MSNTNNNTFWQNLWNPPVPVAVATKRKTKVEETSSSSSNKESETTSQPKKNNPAVTKKNGIKEAKEKTTPKRVSSQDALAPPKQARFWSWIPLPAALLSLWTRKRSTTATEQAQPKSTDLPKVTKPTPPPFPDPPKATKPTPPPSPDPSKTPANPAKSISSSPFKDKPIVLKDVVLKAQAASPDITPGTPATPEAQVSTISVAGQRAKALAPFQQMLLKMKDHFKQDKSQALPEDQVEAPTKGQQTPPPSPAPQNLSVPKSEPTTPKIGTPEAATPKRSYSNRKVQFLTEETYNVPKDQGKPLARRANRGEFNPWRKYMVVAELHKRGGYIMGPGGKMIYVTPGTQPPPKPNTPMDGKPEEKAEEYTDTTERDDDTQLLVTSDKQPKKDTVIPFKVFNEATPVKRKKNKTKKDTKRKVKSKKTKSTKRTNPKEKD